MSDHNRPGFIRRFLEQVTHSQPRRAATAGSNPPDAVPNAAPDAAPNAAPDAAPDAVPETVPHIEHLPPPYEVVVGTSNGTSPSQPDDQPGSTSTLRQESVSSSLQPQEDLSSERSSRAPSVARSARRARVDDAEDEDDRRETNRQRMHSPPHDDHDHRFHPDMHVHAEEHRQERERQQAQPAQAPPANRPQLFNRISLTFDLIPGLGPPPGPVNAANGSAQDATRAPGPSQDTTPAAQDSATAGGDAAPPANTVDLATLFQRLREGMGPFWVGLGGADMDEPDDPKRAKRLLSGLEEVPEGLIKRMEPVGREQGEPVVCAICFDSLLDTESAPFAAQPQAVDPQPMDVDQSPPTSASFESDSVEGVPDDALDHKIVVLPCAHAFHASCLRPWFTRPHRTTCPSCRFDIDPDSLTYTPPARVSRTPRSRPPQAATATPVADTPQTSTPANASAEGGVAVPSASGDGPAPEPAHAAMATAAPPPPPLPQPAPRAPQNFPFGLVLDFNIAIPGLPPLRAQAQGRPQTQGGATGLPHFGPPPLPGHPLADPPNWERFMDDLFGGPAPAAPTSTPGAQSQPQSTQPAPAPPQPAGTPSNATNGTRGPIQSRVVFHSFSIPLTGRDRTPVVTQQANPAGAGQPANTPTALPSFEEFMNLVNLPVPPAFQDHPQSQGAPQPAPQAQAPPVVNAPTSETNAPDQPHAHTQDPHGLDAMVGDLASTLIGALLRGGQFAQATGGHTHTHPPPPGPIPFDIPLNTQHRGPRPPVPEKRQWTPPPPPGLTLREQVEKKERELGLRCSDVSCGLGPSDEDPTPVVDPRTIRQVTIRPRKGKGPENDSVCAHTFHPACLVSAERVAGWSGADQKKEVDGEQEEVEVSCPVCRAVGCISRSDWDEGACALA